MSFKSCPVNTQPTGDVILFLGLIGLSMMEYGSVKPKNAPHLMVKNFVQFSIAIIFYWFLGYGFSFRHTRSDFIGEKAFGGEGWLSDRYLGNGECFSFYVLLGTFVIFIINLAITERTHYFFYMFFPAFLMVFVWPATLAWIYGEGWLTNAIEDPILDYGADITVYTFAGIFAIAAAIIVGKRPKRFEDPPLYRITQPQIYILGCLLTILGVFGIATSQQPITPYNARINAMHNLWISAGASAIVSLKLITIFSQDLNSHYISLYQGFISGMVVIASSAGNTRPWEAGIIGILNGLVFWAAYKFIRFVKVDDSGEVYATFLIPGVIGGILPGFLDEDKGVFWSAWESGQTLGTQTTGTFVVLAWSLFWALVILVPFRLFGLLRLKDEILQNTLADTVISQWGFISKKSDD